MEFRVGQIYAKCPACGSKDFRLPDADYSGPQVNYACTRCRAVSPYSKLIAQIGRETMRLRKERSEEAAVKRTQQPRLRT
jgi:uncharacterized Zn finger protein